MIVRNRYGIELIYPGQPLLRLKQSHNAHNLLVDFNDEGLLSCKLEPLIIYNFCIYPILVLNLCAQFIK